MRKEIRQTPETTDAKPLHRHTDAVRPASRPAPMRLASILGNQAMQRLVTGFNGPHPRNPSSPLATTRDGETTLSPAVEHHPRRSTIVAHEKVHRAQHWAQGQRPTGSVAQLEAEAEVGSEKLTHGDTFEPSFASAVGQTLAYGEGDEPATEAADAAAAFAATDGTLINAVGIVHTPDGANLRVSPDPTETPSGMLPFNTRVIVVRSSPGGWYSIVTLDGRSGYVAANRVRTDLPEPEASLHRIAPNETAQQIARHYYGESVEHGRDERFYVNVLVHVNGSDDDTTRGVYKEKLGDSWSEAQTRAGYLIWIPSPAFASSLKGQIASGSFTGTIKDAIAGFVQGLKDIRDAILASWKYRDVVAARVEDAFWELLVGFVFVLIIAGTVLALSTAIGAIIGAIAGAPAGGVGAGPGAAAGAVAGFEVGLVILKYLGIAFLLAWVGTKAVEVGGAFWTFLKTAWSADGDAEVIDQAAYEFADAVGRFLGFVLQAIIFLAVMWGLPRLLGLLGKTRFGRIIGRTRLVRWLRERLSGAKGRDEGFRRVVSERLPFRGRAAKTAERLGIDLGNLEPAVGSKSGGVYQPRGAKAPKPEEVTLADELFLEFGEEIVLAGRFRGMSDPPAVDGFFRHSGRPLQLKSITAKPANQPAKVVRHANEAFDSAAKHGWSGVEVYIQARGTTVAEVLARWGYRKAPPRPRWGMAGTLSRVRVYCADGAVDIPLRLIRPPPYRDSDADQETEE